MSASGNLGSVLVQRRRPILEQWSEELVRETSAASRARLSREEMLRQANEFLEVLTPAVQSASAQDVTAPEWKEAREFLEALAQARGGRIQLR